VFAKNRKKYIHSFVKLLQAKMYSGVTTDWCQFCHL